MRRCRRRWGALFWLALGAAALPGLPAGAQEASLDEVESLLARARMAEAREILQEWWRVRAPFASRVERQRGLWLRGVMTVDPSLAELDFRRLVVEYPGGPYSDRALFRLAQGSEVRGRLREASLHVEALLQDYPNSSLRAEARGWLEARREELAALPPEEPPSPPPPPPPRTKAVEERIFEEGEGPAAVQLGAFRSLPGARTVEARLREAGYYPRLVRVPGSDLFRVRLGRFPTREEAEPLLLELRRRGFEATIVTDAHREEAVR